MLVRDVVADYSEPSLASALPPIRGAESIVRDVLDGWPGSVRCSATYGPEIETHHGELDRSGQ